MEKTTKQPKPSNHTAVAPKRAKFPPKEPEGFQLTNGSGMKITFPNGYRVLICFGTSHWCANRVVELREPEEVHKRDQEAAIKGCCNGAVYTFDNTWRNEACKINMETLDDATWCHKFQTPMQYLDILNKVASLPDLTGQLEC